MKLISEVTFNDIAPVITEAKDGNGKDYFIEGVFMQGAIQNRNGRMYPMETLQKEVDRYNDQFVSKNRAYGELGHPDGPTINLERVSHMIKSLKNEGNDIVGKAKIMDTPYGKIVKSLIDEGAQLGVSSRGMGSLKQNSEGINEVQGDFQLATAGDIVADPSAPNAFVNGVMEGVEWIYDAASGSWQSQQVIEEIQNTGKISARELQERKLEFFNKFLKSL
tara:strand:- start:768 stop:1430 length:663 start_codon:yes stop_codon:yes gene_type:complete